MYKTGKNKVFESTINFMKHFKAKYERFFYRRLLGA